MAFARARPPSAAGGSSPAGAPRGGSVSPPDDRGDNGDSKGRAKAGHAAARVVGLKRRAEFLAVAATGRRWVAPAFILQAGPPRESEGVEGDEIGIGFTATKRIGGAVARNRAKRRLRDAARRVAPDAASPGRDYVLVARAAVLTCPFQTLLDDLASAFSRVLATKSRPSRADGGRRDRKGSRRGS
jgi:ribonuclease P protein component